MLWAVQQYCQGKSRFPGSKITKIRNKPFLFSIAALVRFCDVEISTGADPEPDLLEWRSTWRADCLCWWLPKSLGQWSSICLTSVSLASVLHAFNFDQLDHWMLVCLCIKAIHAKTLELIEPRTLRLLVVLRGKIHPCTFSLSHLLTFSIPKTSRQQFQPIILLLALSYCPPSLSALLTPQFTSSESVTLVEDAFLSYPCWLFHQPCVFTVFSRYTFERPTSLSKRVSSVGRTGTAQIACRHSQRQ